MDARTLFRSGQIQSAVEALGAELRSNPLDAQRRSFLFELLSLTGEYGRAEKQLDVLARDGGPSQMGTIVYKTVLHAERIRQEMFQEGALPMSGEASSDLSGTLNGQPFSSISDADHRIGARLEVFAAGQYSWIPFSQLAGIHAEAPGRLRDLIWISARVSTSPDFKGVDLGEVFVPALAPLTWQHDEDQVRMGRMTDWIATAEGGEAPIGQKLLLVDGEEIPILEVRELIFDVDDRTTT